MDKKEKINELFKEISEYNPLKYNESINRMKNYLNHIKKFGFVFLTKKIIKEIIKIKKGEILLDIGCGLGLCSKLLKLYGCKKVYCFEQKFTKNTYLKVKDINHIEAINKYNKTKKDVLLLSFPYMDNIAFETLQLFKGNKLIFIGEINTGLNANEAFFEEIRENWILKKNFKIDNFISNQCEFYYYKRK
jgi:hypothetical protein